MSNPRNQPPIHQLPILKLFLNDECQSLEVQAYENQAIHSIRATVANLVAEHSKNANFDADIPYTAMIYFDLYISRNGLPTLGQENEEYSVRVLAFSCLSMAWNFKNTNQEINEYMENLPKNLRLNKMDVYKVENFLRPYSSSDLNLRYAPHLVQYFLSLQEQPTASLKDINELIIQSQGDIRFTQFKPSIIAASAILCLIEANSEFLDKFRGEDVSLDLDRLFTCMHMMTELRDKLSIPIATAPRVIPGSSAEEVSPHRHGKQHITEENQMNFQLKWNTETQDLTIHSPEVKDGSPSVPSPEFKDGSPAVHSPEVEDGSPSVSALEVEYGSSSVPSLEVEDGSPSVPSLEVEYGSSSVPSLEVEDDSQSVPAPEVKDGSPSLLEKFCCCKNTD